jgi:hypothetical protein
VRDRQIAAIRPKPDGVTFPSYHDAGLTIIFAGRRFDHHTGLRRSGAKELAYEALDALIGPAEAVIVHQVLPDGLGIAALAKPEIDDLSVGLAGAGGGTATRRWPESGVTSMAGFELGAGSGGTPLAGFAGACRPHLPGGRGSTPAARREAAAVSRRTPVARWMCRSDHPSRPKAMICCFCSSLKTLLISTEGKPPVVVNVLSQLLWPVLRCPSMAGFGCPPRPTAAAREAS